jgi:signal transduction histidine kinase
VAGIFPPATRLGDGLPSASAEVLRTGRSARLDAVDWSDVSGLLGADSRHLGIVSTVASPIVVEGRTWGAVSISSTDEVLPHDTEKRLEKFSDLVATAIANAEGRAELAASRRRIVTASDDARRRIERDLHDGVQQQLVSLGLELGAMRADPPTGEALKEQLSSVTKDLGSVFDALVETARGIHPAILSQGGLAAALKALGRRSAVPVELHAQIDGRLPDDVEVAAYYVAAEALTNAAKHARASVLHMNVTTDDETLTLIIRDDGVGGADPGAGSGLVGLQDRVEALGGTIKIDSSAESGTSVVVTLPIATEPDKEIEGFLRLQQEPKSHTSPT